MYVIQTVPRRMLDIMRVKAGAVDLTVSVKLTSTYFKAKRPRNTVENLEEVCIIGDDSK